MSFLIEYWKLIAVFFAGVLSAAIAISYFCYYLKWKKGRQKSQPSVSDMVNSSLLPHIQKISAELASNRKQMEAHRKEIGEVKKELERMNAKRRVVEFKAENHTECRYFSIPLKNGTFPEEKANREENENSWYKIEYQKEAAQGKLFYLTGKADRRALNQMDMFLKPVCDIENQGIVNPQHIQMVQPGKVMLKNGSWLVEEKIKLRLS